jgi:hypothetical protein
MLAVVPLRLLRLLLAVFPFWGVFWGMAIATGTGLWIHSYPRWQGLAWGLTEMVHVFLGWPALALWAGYNVHHLTRHWGNFAATSRILGLIVTTSAGIAFLTGVWLVIRTEGGPPGFVRPLHYWTTFPIFPVLLIHTWKPMGRWLKAQLRPSESRATDAPPPAPTAPSPSDPAPADAASAGPEED